MAKKAHGEIRQSQIITTFGPGALLDLPKYSVIVAGLDNIQADIEVHEPRLLEKVKRIEGLKSVTSLRNPPQKKEVFGTDTTGMGAYSFPEWYITTQIVGSKHRERYLVHKNVVNAQKYVDDNNTKYNVVPVRFLSACRHGHIDDINWKRFIHHGPTECKAPVYRFLELGNSGDASDIIVNCTCGASRPLADAKEAGSDGLGLCSGRRPWLGYGNREECTEMARMVIRNASNIYFPQVLGVISIPPKENMTLGDLIFKHLEDVKIVEDKNEFKFLRRKPVFGEDFKDYTDDQIWDCLQAIKKTGQNPDKVSLKDAEFETLFSSEDEIGKDWPAGNFYSKAIKKENWGIEPFMNSFSRLVLVHRLREVRALVGFTRIDKLTLGIDGEFEENEQVHRAALSLNASNWVPAIENRGEGIFIGFDKEKVEAWALQPKVQERAQQLMAGMKKFYDEKEKDFVAAEHFPGVVYYMLHSFAHMLITAVSLECGYPASSIKERIYCTKQGYGVLLFTGSPDAEGTLGGLIEAGREIHKYIKIALEMGELCSNDPICSQHNPSHALDDKYLLGAACHGCLLIAETSCEMSNNLLDRALVVPTLENLGCEFFTGGVI